MTKEELIDEECRDCISTTRNTTCNDDSHECIPVHNTTHSVIQSFFLRLSPILVLRHINNI